MFYLPLKYSTAFSNVTVSLSEVAMRLTFIAPLSSSLPPITATYFAPSLSAYLNCALTERFIWSVSAAIPGRAKLYAQPKRLFAAGVVQPREIRRRPFGTGDFHARRLHDEKQPLYSCGKAHGGRRRAAQLRNQAVVSAAAAHGALRPDIVGDKLEYRAGVIIQPRTIRGSIS